MEKKTAVDVYYSKVFSFGIVTGITAATMSAICFTIEKLLGFYKEISWIPLGIFDVSNVIYIICCYLLLKDAKDENGYLVDKRLGQGKLFLTSVMIIQWAYMSFMIPSRTFWAFVCFFVLLLGFFLDTKLVLVGSISCTVISLISYIVPIGGRLPAKDEYFIPDIVLIVICFCLSLAEVYIFTWFVSNFLVSAKHDELEENNQKMSGILRVASDIVDSLSKAGSDLIKIADDESSSIEELSATSEELLANSDKLNSKLDTSVESMKNLESLDNDLKKSISSVRDLSNTILDSSKSNETALNDLKETNRGVSDSISVTGSMLSDLVDSVYKITETTKLIRGIASKTKMLALNASIEAARAGDAGKGFTVVANEVSKLANDTQTQLADIENVVDSVETVVNDLKLQITKNTEQLGVQDEQFINVFDNMREMAKSLNLLFDSVSKMDSISDKQIETSGDVVNINNDIIQSIKLENEHFSSIASMAESNAYIAENVSSHATSVNKIADDLKELLK